MSALDELLDPGGAYLGRRPNGRVTRTRKGSHPIRGKWTVGDTIIMPSGAEYLCINSEPYTRKIDGRATQLLTWRGDCDRCGADYEFVTSYSRFRPKANCLRCRKRFTRAELTRGRRRPVEPKGGAV